MGHGCEVYFGNRMSELWGIGWFRGLDKKWGGSTMSSAIACLDTTAADMVELRSSCVADSLAPQIPLWCTIPAKRGIFLNAH